MTFRVVVEPAELQSLVIEACAWSDEIFLCIAESGSVDDAFSIWRNLIAHGAKIKRAVVNLEPGLADPHLLRVLNDLGVLRVAPGEGTAMNASLWHFSKGDESRVLLGSASLTPRCFEHAINATIYAVGLASDDFFCGVSRLFERCMSVARVPTIQELESYERNPASPQSFSNAPVARILVRGGLAVVDDAQFVHESMIKLTSAFRLGIDASPSQGAAPPIAIHESPNSWAVRLPGQHKPGYADIVIGKGRPDSACDGMFLMEDGIGRKFFAYRGVFKRRSRIAEELFWATTRYHAVEATLDGTEKTTKVALVCELDSPEASQQVSAFISEFWRLQQHAHDQVGYRDEPEESNFLDEDGEVQVHMVWDTLLGAGPLEKDVAVRVCAERMRDNGLVSYRRLDSSGKLYGAIESAISIGVRAGEFDRPSRGYVRAIEAQLDDDEWRHCLLQVLTQVPTPRDDVVREVAEYAKEYFGIRFERLRSGGRIEKAVKSAINSCIRRDLVVDYGRNLIGRVTGEDIDSGREAT